MALYAPEDKYASAICRTTYGRLSKVFPGLDGDAFRGQMRYIQSRLEEIGQSLLELELEPHPKSIMDFVHRVLPADDSSLQWSSPGSGLTEDPAATLESLYDRLVMAYDEKAERATRSDGDVWRTYKREIESRHLMKYFAPKKFSVADDEVVFDHAWKNGKWHCIQPLSFDYAAGDSIRNKAHQWLGVLTSIREASDEFKVYLLLGEPSNKKLRKDFERARSILAKIPVENELVDESQSAEFADRLERQIAESNSVS